MFVAMAFCSYVAKHSRDMLLPATERTVLDLNSLINLYLHYSQNIVPIIVKL